MGVDDRLQPDGSGVLRTRELDFGHVGQWRGSPEFCARAQLVAIELDRGCGSEVFFVRVPGSNFHPADEVSLSLPDLLGLLP